jgi:hypothetical protein
MKVKDYILNGNCTIKNLDQLNLSIYTSKERQLFEIVRLIKINELPILAETVFEFGGKDMLLLYMHISNKLDKIKYGIK